MCQAGPCVPLPPPHDGLVDGAAGKGRGAARPARCAAGGAPGIPRGGGAAGRASRCGCLRGVRCHPSAAVPEPASRVFGSSLLMGFFPFSGALLPLSGSKPVSASCA